MSVSCGQWFGVWRAAWVGALACMVAACGGGGSSDPDTTAYKVGGSVSGLDVGTLVLQNNGGDDVTLTADGSFIFSTAVPTGDGYEVTVKSAPASPKRVCAVTHGSGTIGSANVTDVTVSCRKEVITLGTSNWGDDSLKFTDDVAALASGVPAAPRVVTGASTNLLNTGLDSLAIDRQRQLAYVVDLDSTVKVFGNVLTTTGDVAPDRTFDLAAPQNAKIVAIDATHDRVYFGDVVSSAIYAVNHASTLSGTVSADAVYSVTGVVRALHYDEAHDSLYAVVGMTGDVEVFESVSTVASGSSASRSFSVENAVNSLRGIWVDGHNDLLYMSMRTASSGGNNVFVFGGASTLNGAYDADDHSGARFPYPTAISVMIDSDDTLYVVGDSATSIDAYADARLLSGDVTATPRTLSGVVSSGYGMDYIGQ